jgi:hypothetical protein
VTPTLWSYAYRFKHSKVKSLVCASLTWLATSSPSILLQELKGNLRGVVCLNIEDPVYVKPTVTVFAILLRTDAVLAKTEQANITKLEPVNASATPAATDAATSQVPAATAIGESTATAAGSDPTAAAAGSGSAAAAAVSESAGTAVRQDDEEPAAKRQRVEAAGNRGADMATVAVCYVCKLASKRGKFDVVKATELGVTAYAASQLCLQCFCCLCTLWCCGVAHCNARWFCLCILLVMHPSVRLDDAPMFAAGARERWLRAHDPLTLAAEHACPC